MILRRILCILIENHPKRVLPGLLKASAEHVAGFMARRRLCFSRVRFRWIKPGRAGARRGLATRLRSRGRQLGRACVILLDDGERLLGDARIIPLRLKDSPPILGAW